MIKASTQKRLLIILIPLYCLVTILFAFPAQAADSVKVIYVNKYGGGDGTGSSWSNSMTLNAALSYEAKPGEKVKVYLQSGEYNISEPLAIKDGFALYGGFSGKESAETGRILLDNDNNGITEPWEFMAPTVLKGKGVILKFAGSGVVDGVTLQSDSDGSGSIVEITSGGKLKNSIVTGRNNADGSIVYLNDGALLSCFIHDNVTAASNGVIHVAGSATISHSRIEKNQAGNGGGIYVDTSEDVYIINNLIVNNKAIGTGTSKGEGEQSILRVRHRLG